MNNIFFEDEHIQMVNSWKNEDVEIIDPVTLDKIPDEFLLRFRVWTNEQNSVLIARDVRILKELLERSNYNGHPLLDPVTKHKYTQHCIDIINNHEYSKNFNVAAFKEKLENEHNVDITEQINNDHHLATNFDEPFRLINIVRYHQAVKIPHDVSFIKISEDYESQNINNIKINYRHAVEMEVPKTIMTTANGFYNMILIALSFSYHTEVKRLLTIMINKQWSPTYDQWTIMDRMAWITINPLEIVSFIRSKRPFMHGDYPDPLPLMRHLYANS